MEHIRVVFTVFHVVMNSDARGADARVRGKLIVILMKLQKDYVKINPFFVII